MKHIEVVCAIIINEKNEIFCCQRGPGRALANKWEFPGGKVEENETREETIVREIKEELNSLIEPIEYVGVSNHEYIDLEKTFSITMHAYKCKLISGNLELSEHIDSKWASIEEMKLMDFAAADIPLIYML